MKSPKTFTKVPSTPTLRQRVRMAKAVRRRFRGRIGNATRVAQGAR